jgi:hypothetical protein
VPLSCDDCLGELDVTGLILVTGVFRKARFAVLIIPILCVVVTAAAAAQTTTTDPAVKITGLSCAKTTFTTVTCTFTTNVPAKSSVATGTDRVNLIPTPDNHYRTAHSITVKGEMPNTRYYALATATAKNGQTSKPAWAGFKTAAPGSSPATVTTRGNKLLLNGRPFFASIVETDNTCPDQALADGSLSLKADIVNQVAATFVPSSCPGDSSTWGDYLTKTLPDRWWRVSNDNQHQTLQAQGFTGLLDWQASVTGVASPKGDDPCANATNLFRTVSAAARNKPVLFQEDVATYGALPGRKSCLTASTFNMQYWASVAGGARGVDYYPQDAGNKSDFDVEPTIMTVGSKNKAQVGTLGPCILTGTSIPATPDQNDKTLYRGYTYDNFIHVGAWKYGNTVCVVAVNTERVPEKVSFTVPALTSASAQVFWENRRISVKSGVITDSFGAQAVHVYVASLSPTKNASL